jgi:ABC-2 type transport system ATP-binding protein
MSRQDAEKAVDAWLSRLGMSGEKNKKLETLSKGNQQKIQLITALAHSPRIVILDEPFSGLDPVNARLLKDIVRETIEKDNIVIFSSHQMNYIEEFCDDIAILNAGKVAIGGSLRDIKRNYVRDKLTVKTQEVEKVIAEFGDSVRRAPDGTLILQMPSADDKKAYMARLIGCCDVDCVEVFEPSLNDIFVEYAEKEI